MLLKKLAKLRRTILWCAVFAVSHLAFGANFDADPVGWLGMPDLYNSDYGGYLCVAPAASYTAITNNLTKGTVTNKVLSTTSNGNVNKLEITASPITGYSFDHWNTFGHYYGPRPSSYQGYFMLTNAIASASLVLSDPWPGIPQWEATYNLEPVFTANVYRVTYNPNGGTCSTSSKSVTYDSAYGALPIPTLAHNDFAGWTLNGKSITATNVVQTAANHTLTATWKEHDKYTVTISSSNVEKIKYCIDDGQSYDLSADNRIYNVYSNSCVKVWAEPKEGYSFANTSVQTAKTIPAVTPSANTLSLVATANTYTVEFVPNGGSGSMSNQSMTYDTEVKLAANSFTRTGYTFAGWATSSSGAVAYANNVSVKNLSSTSGATVTLYAKWSANPYTIAFNANGGSGSMSSLSMTYDIAKNLTANSFTRTGYTFCGWSFGEQSFVDGAEVKNLTSSNGATVTLKAIWKANAYTITFDPNNGAGAMTSLPMTYDTEKTLPTSTFTRDHYYFLGWSASQTASSATYADGATVKNLTSDVAGSVTLYAVWREHPKYTVYVSTGTGVESYSSSPEVLANIYSNSVVKVWGTAKPGYTLAASSEANAIDIAPLVCSTNITLTATANKYTIVFDKNDPAATGTMNSMIRTYDENSTYLTANGFTKTGYTFKGWMLSSDATEVSYGDKHYGRNYAESGSITLYAKWTPNTYTIAFDRNGGSGSMSNQSMTYNTAANLTANAFTRTGYTFAGWATSSDGAVAYANMVSVTNLSSTSGATVTLYAKWSANPYTIAFNANGGSGSMSNQSMTYDTAANLTANSFTRDHYYFLGWSASQTASSATYADGATVNNLTSAAGGSVMLYAVWREHPKYSVSVTKGTGVDSYSSDPEVLTNIYSNSVVKVWGTAKPGYTLAASSESTAIEIAPLVSSTNVTLTATANTYTVTLDPAEGSLPEGQSSTLSVKFASTYPALPAPTRTGYTFSGWYLGSDRIYEESTYVRTADEHTLVAHWSAKTYTLTTKVLEGGDGAISVSPNKYQYEYGTSVTLTAVPETGYSFAYWKDDPEIGAERSITINDSDNSYSAAFTANVYRVTFNANPPQGVDPAPSPSFSSRYYTYGGTYDELPTISHYAYEFRGWYTTRTSGGTKITNDSFFRTTNDDTILYARWQVLPRYSVEFEDGTGVDKIFYKRNPEDAEWVEYSESVEVISNLTISAYATARPGYTADTSAAEPFTSDPIYTEDGASFTLTATPNTYTVSFNLSYETSATTSIPDPITVTYDSTYGSLPTPTRVGYTFAGWYLDNTRIYPTTSVETAADHTLVAHWYEYDVSLTEAADCNQWITLKNYVNNKYEAIELAGAKNGTAVAITNLLVSAYDSSNSPALMADIKGNGTLSFSWKIKNEAKLVNCEAEAVLIVNGVEKAWVYNHWYGNRYPESEFKSVSLSLENVESAMWVFRRYSDTTSSIRSSFYLDDVRWIPEGKEDSPDDPPEKTELEKWAELLGCEATEIAVADAKSNFEANCKLSISFDATGKPNIDVTGVDPALASKVKIECCEDLSNPSWNEHNPAQHSNCRFFRGTLELTVH